jgi:hypothetical protein
LWNPVEIDVRNCNWLPKIENVCEAVKLISSLSVPGTWVVRVAAGHAPGARLSDRTAVK